MCEILIRARDKVNATSVYLDVQCTKRGDVISVQENGWAWGSEELSARYWRIVKLPNVSVSAAVALLVPELPVNPLIPSKTLQRRGFRWNVNAASLPAAVRNWINDDSRAAPSRTVNLSESQFLALIEKKPPVVDPNVFA